MNTIVIETPSRQPTGGDIVYQYKDGNMNVTIILRYVTSVYCRKVSSTFDIYLTDNGEPNEVPIRYYDDFMNKLKAHVKSQAQ